MFIVLAEPAVAPELAECAFDDPAPFDDLEALRDRRVSAIFDPDRAGRVVTAAEQAAIRPGDLHCVHFGLFDAPPQKQSPRFPDEGFGVPRA